MNSSTHAVLFMAASALPFAASCSTFEYDANGNLIRITDPLGRTSTRQYDAFNRLVREKLPPAGPGSSGATLGYIYDGMGQLTAVTDPRSLKTTYTVNGLGNQLALNSPDTGTTSRTFDGAGNLVSSKDARGLLTTYAYDAGNRLTRIAYASGIATAFEYGADSGNATGRLTRMTDESGETSFQYDAAGRLLSKVQTVRHGTATRQFKVGYSYGQSGAGHGKIVSITYPSGNRILLDYGSDGRVSDLHAILNGGTTTTALLRDIRYLPMGLPESWSWGNGHRYQREYDLQGRLTQFPLGDDQRDGMIRTLEYDAAGNVKAARHTRKGNAATELNQYFGYDGLGRLTAFNSGSTSQAFGYDASGNRTQFAVGTRIYAYRTDPASNRLLSADGPLPIKAYFLRCDG